MGAGCAVPSTLCSSSRYHGHFDPGILAQPWPRSVRPFLFNF